MWLMQTFKKRKAYYEGKLIFMNFQNMLNPFVSILVFVVVVNGRIWNTANSCIKQNEVRNIYNALEK
jgi:hypothetical protein